MPGWRVELTPAAVRQLRRLRGEDLLVLRGAILALAGNPFPPTVRKLTDADLWRIRLSIHGVPWRVVYQVRERERLVIITRVARRDESTYRGI
jgi:mRNA interferase RelE/StbE